MTETVPATFAPVAIKPGWRLAPALFGKPGNQGGAWVECPEFCAESHVDQWTQHAADLDHWGTEGARWDVATMHDPGMALLVLSARLYLDPNNPDPRMSAATVRVDDESVDVFLTPDMAEQAADELIAFAGQLRNLARQARTFNERSDRLRRSQADEALRRARPWLELTLDDVDRLPVSRLLKAFGVTVIEDGACPDGQTAALTGKPGAMTLSYQQDVTQAEREQTVRGLLADHVAVSR